MKMKDRQKLHLLFYGSRISKLNISSINFALRTSLFLYDFNVIRIFLSRLCISKILFLIIRYSATSETFISLGLTRFLFNKLHSFRYVNVLKRSLLAIK